MSLNKGKHIVEEIGGVRCTLVEAGISAERATFLKRLLEHNGYEVKMEKDSGEEGPETFRLGVTDLLFHAVVDVYKRRLVSLSGKRVTPAYWLQLSEAETEEEVNYYNTRR
ncbi:MAG TPA: hypothetical protein P5550_01705 [Bacteroidales bacterium]|nr:hypothetical protein [Bacteroidales bacterium]HRZ77695.1 hypothetical protein [Bacteroidales bacterium]